MFDNNMPRFLLSIVEWSVTGHQSIWKDPIISDNKDVKVVEMTDWGYVIKILEAHLPCFLL